MRRFLRAAFALFALCAAGAANAATILDAPPAKPDPKVHYLFYLHGRILEIQGAQAVSPDYGAYEYRSILDKLASRGHVVIAELRTTDVDRQGYARKTADQVRALLAGGVPANHITVAGFSKGGFMTLLTAKELQNPNVNFVTMAGCFGDLAHGKDARVEGLKGRILSMVDYKDSMCVSCAPLFARNPEMGVSKDVVVQAGTGHGFFFKADPAWIDPLLDWAR